MANFPLENLIFIAYSDERWLYYQFSLPHALIHFCLEGWDDVLFKLGIERVNPFTPENDQFQISPPEILHQNSMRNLAFHSFLRWEMIILPYWEHVLFELGSERVKEICKMLRGEQFQSSGLLRIFFHLIGNIFFIKIVVVASYYLFINVLQVCLEGDISKSSIMSSLSRGKRASGDLIPWTVSQQVSCLRQLIDRFRKRTVTSSWRDVFRYGMGTISGFRFPNR